MQEVLVFAWSSVVATQHFRGACSGLKRKICVVAYSICREFASSDEGATALPLQSAAALIHVGQGVPLLAKSVRNTTKLLDPQETFRSPRHSCKSTDGFESSAGRTESS